MRQDRAACIATHAFTLLLGLALAGCAEETVATAAMPGTQARDEVATLLDAQLEARGYAIGKKLDIGPQRWRFVKDGRNGMVDVDQHNTDMPTAITINLFVGDTP